MRLGVHAGRLPKAISHPAARGRPRQMISHETLCLFNISDLDADVRITVYFSDREPVGPYGLSVPVRRMKHLRFNELSDPAPIPPDTDYASVVESTVTIVVQQTRLNYRQAKMPSSVPWPSRPQ